MVKRIKYIMRTAFSTVPYYNDLFIKEKIDVDDENILDVFSKIPITDKNTIKRVGWPNFINCDYLDKDNNLIKDHSLHITKTSGTTGEPMHILWKNKDYYSSTLEHWKLRSKIAKIKPTDKCCLVSHDNRGSSSYVMTPYELIIKLHSNSYSNAVEYLKEWIKFDPVWVYMPVSILSYFVNIAREEKLDIRGNIRYIEYAEEPVMKDYAENVESYFGLRGYDMYGCQEINGIAMQCQFGNYHLMNGNVYAEVYSEDTFSQYGRGNICVTSLHNTAMPFIRYKLNDIVTISPSECECGNCSPIVSIATNRFSTCIELRHNKISMLYPVKWFKAQYARKVVKFNYLFDIHGSTFCLECTKEELEQYRTMLTELFNNCSISLDHISLKSISCVDSFSPCGVILID